MEASRRVDDAKGDSYIRLQAALVECDMWLRRCDLARLRWERRAKLRKSRTPAGHDQPDWV